MLLVVLCLSQSASISNVIGLYWAGREGMSRGCAVVSMRVGSDFDQHLIQMHAHTHTLTHTNTYNNWYPGC